MNDKKFLKYFRALAIIEGISVLLLFFVGMPLKYYANLPMATKVTGWLHGFLFVIFVLAALRASVTLKWKNGEIVMVLLSSVVPFGMLWFDRKLKKDVCTLSADTHPDSVKA